MSAIADWNEQVRVHHAQSLRAMGGEEPAGDFWVPLAHHFVADPLRSDDPEVERLSQFLRPGDTLLDVGGGAGRLALPLALRCAQATVVEPSGAMTDLLLRTATEAGIGNVTVVQDDWEYAEVDPADVVLCAHVVYGVEDIEAFIAKMTAKARKAVVILLYLLSPQAPISPFWKRVHGEDRVHLPATPELLAVLWEMGIFPDLEMMRAIYPKPFESWQVAHEELRGRLYVEPDTAQDQRLTRAMKELLVEEERGVTQAGAEPRRLGLITWQVAS